MQAEYTLSSNCSSYLCANPNLPDDLVFEVNYFGRNMPTFVLNFSRPGGEVICQYCNFLRLGRDGYRVFYHACHDTAALMAREIAKLGPFKIIYGGTGSLPAVCWTLKDGVNPGYTLCDFADRLRNRGWQVPAYSMPPNRSDLVVQRILVRHGFGRDLAELLLDDFRRTIDYFLQHPVVTPLAEHEAGGQNHAGRYTNKHAKHA